MVIKAILGTGNPGKEYKKTYHNVGKWVAEKLRAKYKKEMNSDLDFTTHEAYVNVSSTTARVLMKNKSYGPESVLVVHDDSDLLCGQYKLTFGGGSAGHKGVQDLINWYSTQYNPSDFWRLRIGIRDPKEQTRKKAGEFVLKFWSKAEEVQFEQALERAWEEMKAKKMF